MSTSVELVPNEAGVSRVVFQSANGIQILSRATLDKLKTVLKALKGDKSVRIVVFEAQGRTFLAGADLAELKALNRKSARPDRRRPETSRPALRRRQFARSCPP